MLGLYETFYKLKADPFRLSSDYTYAYDHRSYAKAKATLRYALDQGEGFVVITGGAGTGKTTLVDEMLAEMVGNEIVVARLVSTQLDAHDMLRMLALSFGIPTTETSRTGLLRKLEDFLGKEHKQGRRAALIIDEAQGLSVDAMEELQSLSSLQAGIQPLLQMFLVGEESLRELINTPSLQQLQSRVIATSKLEPVDINEVREFIEHRLKKAGWNQDPKIDPKAYRLIHAASRGIPGRMNLMCGRMLLRGIEEETHELTEEDANIVIEELQQEMLIDVDLDEIDAMARYEPPTRASRPIGNQPYGNGNFTSGGASQPGFGNAAVGGEDRTVVKRPAGSFGMTGNRSGVSEDAKTTFAKRPLSPADDAKTKYAAGSEDTVFRAPKGGFNFSDDDDLPTRKGGVNPYTASSGDGPTRLGTGSRIASLGSSMDDEPTQIGARNRQPLAAPGADDATKLGNRAGMAPFPAKDDDATRFGGKQPPPPAPRRSSRPSPNLDATQIHAKPKLSKAQSEQDRWKLNLDSANTEYDDDTFASGYDRAADPSATLGGRTSQQADAWRLDVDSVLGTDDMDGYHGVGQPRSNLPMYLAVGVLMVGLLLAVMVGTDMISLSGSQRAPASVRSDTTGTSQLADAGSTAEKAEATISGESPVFTMPKKNNGMDEVGNEENPAAAGESPVSEEDASAANDTSGAGEEDTAANAENNTNETLRVPEAPQRTEVDTTQTAKTSETPAVLEPTEATDNSVDPSTAEARAESPTTTARATPGLTDTPATTGGVEDDTARVPATDYRSDVNRSRQLALEQLKTTLLTGIWTSAGKPAAILSSDITRCKESADLIACRSVAQKAKTKYGEVTYFVESELKRFGEDSTFTVEYLTKVALASASATANPNWQITKHAMNCRLVKERTLRCFSEKSGTRHYHRVR